jgi:hypothetical protein
VGGVHATVVLASGVPLPDDPLVPPEPDVLPASFDPLEAEPLVPLEPAAPLEPDLPVVVPDVPVVDPLEAEPVTPLEPVEPAVVPEDVPEKAPAVDPPVPLEPVTPPEPVEPAVVPVEVPEDTPLFDPLDWPEPLDVPLPDAGFDVPPVPSVLGDSPAHATATTAPMAKAAIEVMLRFEVKLILRKCLGLLSLPSGSPAVRPPAPFPPKVRKKIRRLPFWADS